MLVEQEPLKEWTLTDVRRIERAAHRLTRIIGCKFETRWDDFTVECRHVMVTVELTEDIPWRALKPLHEEHIRGRREFTEGEIEAWGIGDYSP